MKKILFFFVAIIFAKSSLGSHLVGGEVTYKYIGTNQYIVTVTIFRDCQGIVAPASLPLTVKSSCGFNQTFTFLHTNSFTVSSVCPTTCSGGTIQGVELHNYIDTITLSASCNFYTLSWTGFARTSSISNIVTPANDSLYVPATLYSAISATNSSPVFSSSPLPVFAANIPVAFNASASDMDGDSLVYSMAQPMAGATNTIAYVSGYTLADPFPSSNGVNINTNTGELTFTPTSLGVFTIVIVCKEYDRTTGLQKGSIKRDINISVIPPSSILSNISGNVSSLLGNITQGQVLAFNSDSSGSISPVGTSLLDLSGNYNIQNLLPGNYKIRTLPDTTIYNDSISKTYYPNTFLWDSAYVVTTGCGTNDVANINAIHFNHPTTNGSVVSGYVLADANYSGKINLQGDPIPGVDVALEQNPGSITYVCNTTDTMGFYSFSNIPIGTYTILATIPGYGLDSAHSITITTNGSSLTQQNYLVSDSIIYIDNIVASIKNLNLIKDDILLYPNPTMGIIYINNSLNVRLINIYDLTGRLVAKKEIGNDNFIDITSLTNGIYTININNLSGSEINKKVIVNK